MNHELQKLLRFIGFKYLGEYQEDNFMKLRDDYFSKYEYKYIHNGKYFQYILYYYSNPDRLYKFYIKTDNLNKTTHYLDTPEGINLCIISIKETFKFLLRKKKLINLLQSK